MGIDPEVAPGGQGLNDLLPLLQKERDLEKAFVAEVAGKPEPSSGWTPTMTMFRFISPNGGTACGTA